MMNELKKKVLVEGVQLKIEQGQKLEDILATYTKLTEAEKTEIREAIA